MQTLKPKVMEVSGTRKCLFFFFLDASHWDKSTGEVGDALAGKWLWCSSTSYIQMSMGHNSKAGKMQPIQGIIKEEEHLQQRSSNFQYLHFNCYKLRKVKIFSVVQAIYSDLELQLYLSHRKYCLTSTQKGEKN